MLRKRERDTHSSPSRTAPSTQTCDRERNKIIGHEYVNVSVSIGACLAENFASWTNVVTQNGWYVARGFTVHSLEISLSLFRECEATPVREN